MMCAAAARARVAHGGRSGYRAAAARRCGGRRANAMCALDSDGLREHGCTAMRRTPVDGPTIVTSCGMHWIFGEIPRANIADTSGHRGCV